MVGVRSSRGCKLCRKKKRGCDLSQPICGQCSKLGAKCAYEDRAWIFIASHQQCATTEGPSIPTQAPFGPSSLLLADQRQQLETAYLEAYLPSGEATTETVFTNSVVATWIPTIRYLASKDHITRLAFDSCVLLALGQIQSNLDFTNHGMAMYCQALSKTNRALQNAATAQTDSMLATCQVLAMCEKYRPHVGSQSSTQATDFQRHVEGTARLLELRGTYKHAHEHSFTLFAHARSVIAHAGIAQRRRTYLGSVQWLEVPWNMNHRQRTLKDKLVDLMLGVAASLEQLDQCGQVLPSERQPSDKLVEACACMCITSAMKLEAWEKEAGEAWPRARLEDICAKQGFGIFHLIMSYWAVSLLLSARCCALLDRISESTPALQTLASLLPNAQKCAVAIATYAHRYFTPTTGLVGPQYATFPLGIAIYHFNAIRTPGMQVRTQPGAGKESDAEVAATTAMEHIEDLFRTNERARSTAQFLRRMASESSS
jgi:hypothetical protein